jgi:hypothetical protein
VSLLKLSPTQSALYGAQLAIGVNNPTAVSGLLALLYGVQKLAISRREN